jgi:hypothetical protein
MVMMKEEAAMKFVGQDREAKCQPLSTGIKHRHEGIV